MTYENFISDIISSNEFNDDLEDVKLKHLKKTITLRKLFFTNTTIKKFVKTIVFISKREKKKKGKK